MRLLKNLTIYYLQKENKDIKKILSGLLKNNNFFFLDIGAAEGIPKRWKLIEDIVSKILIEPHPESAKILKNEGYDVIDKVLYSEVGKKLEFNHTKKEMCSSFLEPNQKHLSKFLNSDRFDIIKKTSFTTSTLDEELERIDKKPDFIKIDTEGAEIEILKGSKNCLKNILGMEIESSFFPLRKNQPLISDILNFLSNDTFEFVDLLTIVRWEKNNYRFTGQPQISDLLFLVKPETIVSNFKDNIFSREVLIKYICILAVYLRSDYLMFLNNHKEIKKEIPQLKELCKLVEKKIKKINFIEKYSYIFKHKIYNNL